MKKYLKLARVDHWVKNLFIVPGTITAYLLLQPKLEAVFLRNFVIGILATCFIASANYVINEWLDAEFDQYHPIKKNRPAVTENLNVVYIVLEYVFFVAIGLTFASFVNFPFLLMEVWLLLMGILYNVKPIRTKDIPYVDVLSESINNLIRLLLGWFMFTDSLIPPSSLMLGYWMCGAFLMAVKRFAEYGMIADKKVAGLYRKSFQYYTRVTLLCSSFFYAMCATFLIGIFMIKYRIEYLLTVPVMMMIFVYYFYLSYKEDSVVQKPEKLYREKGLIFMLFLFSVVFLLMTFIDLPILKMFHTHVLMEI